MYRRRVFLHYHTTCASVNSINKDHSCYDINGNSQHNYSVCQFHPVISGKSVQIIHKVYKRYVTAKKLAE